MQVLSLVEDPSSKGATFNDVLIKLLQSNLGLILVVCGFIFCLIAVLGEVQASRKDAATHINPGKGGRLFGGILGVVLILAGIGWMGSAEYRAKADAQKAQQDAQVKADTDAKAKADAAAKAAGEAKGKADAPTKRPPHVQPRPAPVAVDSPTGGADQFSAAALDPNRLGPPTSLELIFIHARLAEYEELNREKAMAVTADGHGNFVYGRSSSADARSDVLTLCRTNASTRYPKSCRIIMLDDTRVGDW